MNYRNARLANGFLSLDQLAGEIDLVKSRVVSDGGAGVERMVGDVDRKPGDAAGPLQTATKRVKYLKVADPTTITNVHGVFDTNVDKVTMGNEVEIVGTKLDAGDVKVKWLDEGEPKSLTLSDGFIGSREADKIVTTENWWPSTTIAAGSEVTFEVNGVEHGGVLVQG